jgi:hypothetical protein
MIKRLREKNGHLETFEVPARGRDASPFSAV